jgi:ABC-type Zn uptake system ZnuABC Zn-binding protein ZnuA
MLGLSKRGGGRRRWAGLAVAAMVAAGSAACSGGDLEGLGAGGRVVVVATTTQLADFVGAIGGDRVDLVAVVRPGVDPHDFEASPRDLEALRRARLVVRNGVDLEPWLDDALAASGARGTVVDTSRGVAIRGGGEEAGPGAADPHIWQDPRNAQLMVASIGAALSAADPAGAATYSANVSAYGAQLDTLDAEIAAAIGSLPNKKLVTDHDAFGYYVDRYGLELVATIIPSFESSAELSASDVSELVAEIRAEGVKAIFVETTVPAKTARAIAREAGVEVVSGEDSLYGDALGPPGSDGATYLQMMRHNTRVIVDNLR